MSMMETSVMRSSGVPRASSASRGAGMDENVREVLSRYWGFDELRPLQKEAIDAVMAGRDSIVVMPTGGGKSLCYQAPAVVRNVPTIVVSPLLSLMKDQVDSLQANGVQAVEISSARTAVEQRDAAQLIREGRAPLVFVSPERLLMPRFLEFLREVGVRTFAIDEAHCISHWGHDFRPEYRQLSRLKEIFPGASVHAYTATATERVRADIAKQLGLRDPVMLVGNFDRPNLRYRVVQRTDVFEQVRQVVEQHRGEAGIVYCLRRRDVDDMTGWLQSCGVQALGYHAGMSNEDRKKAQEEFLAERCDLVVATIAFGMGIDRSNIRFVLHANMPKSIEHYQQETGRAGRDGLEAECALLYSPADVATWRSIYGSVLDNSIPTFRKRRRRISTRWIGMRGRRSAGIVRWSSISGRSTRRTPATPATSAWEKRKTSRMHWRTRRRSSPVSRVPVSGSGWGMSLKSFAVPTTSGSAPSDTTGFRRMAC